MFHKHKFQLKDSILWCECGKIKILPCQHKWMFINQTRETIFGRTTRLIQLLECEKCGDRKTLDIE